MFKKLKCPHCDKEGISTIRKLFLGPAVPAKCKECGKKVGVPHSSMISIVPFMLSLIIVHHPSMSDSGILLDGLILGAGAFAMCFYHMKFVPLEKR